MKATLYKNIHSGLYEWSIYKYDTMSPYSDMMAICDADLSIKGAIPGDKGLIRLKASNSLHELQTAQGKDLDGFTDFYPYIDVCGRQIKLKVTFAE